MGSAVAMAWPDARKRPVSGGLSAAGSECVLNGTYDHARDGNHVDVSTLEVSFDFCLHSMPVTGLDIAALNI